MSSDEGEILECKNDASYVRMLTFFRVCIGSGLDAVFFADCFLVVDDELLISSQFFAGF